MTAVDDRDEWEDEEDVSDGLAFEPVVRPKVKKRRTGLWISLLVLLLLGGGAGAGWYLYGDTLFLDDQSDVPLVKADTGPVKVRPEKPGGMEIPNRDKLVYDRMKGGEGRSQVERLLPQPEKLLSVPASKAAPALSMAESLKQAARDMAKEMPKEGAVPPPPPAPETALKKEEAKKTPPKPVPLKPTAKVPSTKDVMAVRKPAPAPPPPSPENAPGVKAKATKGKYRVQLAAVRSEERAQKEWDRLKGKHKDLLGRYRLFVERADLGAKGVFYRLQVGPVIDEQNAKNLCAKLSKRKVGCLIKRPSG